ncbi:MAG: 3-deoxy-8-phosphooctulonate synthase [bacterium]|nr:3-deoxy-8-phosphooctulonate synthase [Planctomycetota bacterium]HIL52005.1 3-deoxy-8-phosphooctulonate synthase [Planctomycetota bacterium]
MPIPTARSITIGNRQFGSDKMFLIAGPCVLEREDLTLEIAGSLRDICAARDIPLIFKASFDKANRSSLDSGRGPGMQTGLTWLARVGEELELPLLTDVHLPEQCVAVAEVVDVLQIPAFLSRQTDLLVAAARCGKAVNIKKGQFLAPWDMQNAVAKCIESGNPNVLVTERGSSFGYGRLVVDMTGFAEMARHSTPVVFDATHAVQQPGALGKTTGGDRRSVPPLARAAVATGAVDGLFFEVHPDPDSSPSDAPNILHLDSLGELLDELLAVRAAVAGSRA